MFRRALGQSRAGDNQFCSITVDVDFWFVFFHPRRDIGFVGDVVAVHIGVQQIGVLVDLLPPIPYARR